MKKIIVLIAMLTLLLVGCGNKNNEPLFTEEMAIPFEILNYEEKIAPVLENVVPYIAYAKTEGQLASLESRFKVENVDIDLNDYMALFVVVKTNSCGVSVSNVFDRDGIVSVQLELPESDNCDDDPVPHTFVLKVPKGNYEKVQLYSGVVLKSTLDIKE